MAIINLIFSLLGFFCIFTHFPLLNGRMIDDLDEDCGLIEVLSCNLPGETEENHKHLSQNSLC
jgi:hypothetical protein